MARLRCLVLTTLVLGCLGSTAQAQVIVRTPAVNVVVPARVPVVVPSRILPAPAVPVELGAPPAVPLDAVPVRPVPPVATAVRVQTVSEFVAGFRPASTAGRYEVILQHPCTGCPVKVCFHLPCGCPKKIRTIKNGFEVRYGLCKAVTVRFLADGTVRVRD
jgi:hypothetical protein